MDSIKKNPFAKQEERQDVEVAVPIQETKQEKTFKYRNIRGYKLIRADGSIIKEQTGRIVVPVTEEEVAICKYFTGMDYLVEL